MTGGEGGARGGRGPSVNLAARIMDARAPQWGQVAPLTGDIGGRLRLAALASGPLPRPRTTLSCIRPPRLKVFKCFKCYVTCMSRFE